MASGELTALCSAPEASLRRSSVLHLANEYILGTTYFKLTFFLCSTWSGSALIVKVGDRQDQEQVRDYVFLEKGADTRRRRISSMISHKKM